MRPLALLLLCGCGEEPLAVIDPDRIDGMVSADPISVGDRPLFTIDGDVVLPLDTPPLFPLPDFVPPVTGRITTVFGARDDGSLHDAVDIAAPIGAEVRAPADIVVQVIAYQTRAGRFIIAETVDETWRFTFAHLSHVDAVEGQSFAKGDVIGLIGLSGAATGPHLHFRVERIEKDGRVAVDPLAVFAENALTGPATP